MKTQRLYNNQTSGSIGCTGIAVKPLLGAWAGLSLLTFVATWAIQVVVLGMVFPDWGTAEGLLVGHDGVGFYALAVERFELIRGVGWSAWELRPETQTIAGVMSAWFVITMPHPLMWAVLQSVVYGLGGATLFIMLQTLVNDWRWAFVAVVIVLFLPSAATIYSLPHHDAFVFAGFMLFVWGWSLVFRLQLAPALSGVFIAAVGFWLMVLFRSFLEHIFLLVAVCLFFVSLGIALFHTTQARQPRALLGAAAPLGVVILIAFLMTGQRFNLHPDSEPSSSAVEGAEILEQKASAESGFNHGPFRWLRSHWLPVFLDERVEQLAIVRDLTTRVDGHGRSSIDLNIRFESFEDVVYYLPRALQIGYLSPFPSQWLPHPDAPPNRQMERVIAGAEMLIIYLIGLPAFLLAIWHWRREPLIWIVLITTGVYILTYALAFPVVGSLVRYRFPAFALTFGIAAAYALSNLHKLRR